MPTQVQAKLSSLDWNLYVRPAVGAFNGKTFLLQAGNAKPAGR